MGFASKARRFGWFHGPGATHVDDGCDGHVEWLVTAGLPGVGLAS